MEKDSLQSSGLGDPEIVGINQKPSAGTIEDIPTLDQNFNLLSACSLGLSSGNAWAVFGASIVASLYNGGPAGMLYEYITVTLFYIFITASIAELASAMPVSGGVYHWASLTAGPQWGRVCGWFAGWVNGLAWIFAVASNSQMISNMVLYAYSLYHPGLEIQRWHIFICYLIMTLSCCLIVMFANRALPWILRSGAVLIVAGFFVTIIVCAVMPTRTGRGYQPSSVVWAEWSNDTGYSSNGFVFLAGMLNGAYAVGAIDCITHIAEEIPRAEYNVPKALACQIIMALVTGLCYLISLFYAIYDLPGILSANSTCPLGDIYLQATGSKAGAVGLLAVSIAPIYCATIGCLVTASRTIYTLGRDDATPFSSFISAIDRRWKSPLWATFACGVCLLCMGAIYMGSTTAFNAFIGSFVVLTTFSYFLAIFPHLLSGRKRIRPGPFWMGKIGFFVNTVACAYIVFSIIIFCFPYALPVDEKSMNYTSVMTVGLSAFVAVWWFMHGRGNYTGPQLSAFQ